MKGLFLKKFGVLTLAMAIGMSSTAFAKQNNPDTTESGSAKKIEAPKDCHKKHGKAHMKHSKVFENMGIKKEDIKNARKSGKSIFDLAKEKGYTESQVKDMLIKDRTEEINNAVKEGKLTREEADKKIIKVKEKISKWDGTIKARKEQKQDSSKQ